MKKPLKWGLLALAAALALAVLFSLFSGGGPARALPDQFTVKERLIFKVKSAFDIEANGDDYGVVTERLVSLKRSFVFTDNSGATVATAYTALLSWGTQIDIEDGAGNSIGSIKEEVFSSMFKTWTTYKILDGEGNVVAYSHKSEILATDITLVSTSGKTVAEVHRGWFNWFGDSWTVTVKDRSVIDPRILPFIAAYKTQSDNDKESKDSGGGSGPSKKK
ncbi:MAG: hypothetical protein WC714_28095 [Candidatus Obscuribacterales bacterium]|jgi:uncharacterized protein YxjI